MVKIAEQICNIEKIGIGVEPTADDIWRTLLHVATVNSRFEIYTTPKNVMSESEIPHVVLSNLLDFAVTSEDLEERRKYIERIMTLTKTEQRILMSIIDRMKKTLPRKPKTSSATPGPKCLGKKMRARSPRGVHCGKTVDLGVVEGPDAPIPDPSAVSDKATDGYQTPDESENLPLLVDDSQRSGSGSGSFSTPKRERNVHGIPQTEPPRRESGRERSRSSFRGDNTNVNKNLFNRYQCRERQRGDPETDDEEREAQQQARQPEGRYMSMSETKRCHKGFSSPPRDRQRKSKGFASPSKQRNSFGSGKGLPLPLFRGRQSQTQRAAFSSINNQGVDHQGAAPSTKSIGLAGPPPPPPPRALNGDAKAPLPPA